MTNKFLIVSTIALVAGMVAGGAGFSASKHSRVDSPIQCSIEASESRGMTIMEGLLQTDSKVRGSYSFRVVSHGRSGSSQIQQGGEFTASPDDPVKLGKVMIGGSPKDYDVSLKVTIGDKTYRCSEFIETDI